MLESDDTIAQRVFRVAIGFGRTPSVFAFTGTTSNKSSVDDFAMELGIVRARVGLSYDPLRLSPSSGDLWIPPQISRNDAGLLLSSSLRTRHVPPTQLLTNPTNPSKNTSNTVTTSHTPSCMDQPRVGPEQAGVVVGGSVF